MYTLRLILTGLVFLVPGLDDPEEEMWVLFPNPEEVLVATSTSRGIQATPQDLDEHRVLLSFLRDGECVEPIPLGDRSNHATIRLQAASLEEKLFYVDWPHECSSPADCDGGAYFDIREDFGWVVSMQEVLRRLRESGCGKDCAAEFDRDLVDGALDTDLLSSRLRLTKGRVKTGTLWGELRGPDGPKATEAPEVREPETYILANDFKTISPARAMARTVVVDLLVKKGKVRLTRVSETGGKLEPIVITGEPGATVVLAVSNFPVGINLDHRPENGCVPFVRNTAGGVGHFMAYYRLFTADSPESFHIHTPVPRMGGGQLDNPQCEPVTLTGGSNGP